MQKTNLLYLTLLLILSLTLFSFAQDKTRLVIWGFPEDESWVGVHAQAKYFEKLHPNVEVVMGVPGGRGGMDPQKLMTAIAGGTPPDLIWQDRFAVGSWAARDAFLALDDLIARDSVNPNEYYPACWQETIYQGHVYALPYNTDARALYYNKDLFREVGLDPNRPPKDWDELEVYAKKLTKFENGKPIRMGFIPNFGNSWLYLYGWQNGGEFMSPDGKICTLNDQRIVEALEWMVKVYDMLGGRAKVVSGFEAGFQGQITDAFNIGKVAMKIDGDWCLDGIARYAPNLNFGVAPPPSPKGKPIITWSGGFSLAIPVSAKHPELAWQFAKWMNSIEGNIYGGKIQQEFNRKHGKPFYIPRMSANKQVNQVLFSTFLPDDPNYQSAIKTFLDLLEVSRFRPVTPVGQLLWDEHVRAFDDASYHIRTPKEALDFGTKNVQKELDKIFKKKPYKLLNVPITLTIVFLLVGMVFLYLIIRFLIALPRNAIGRQEAFTGLLFASPWLLGFLIFTIGPIVASIIFSFCEYDVLHPAKWVGFDNYLNLLWFKVETSSESATYTKVFTVNDPLFWKSIWNTVYMAIFGVPLSMLLSLSIAMLLNTNVRGMTLYRTIFYLPAIVPVVASTILWRWFLNPQTGIMNVLLSYIGITGPNWIGDPLWTKPALIIMLLWGAGGGMIIWLAGLKGIPEQLYEAAEIDGSNWWQRFWHITIPMLTPYIFFNLIMGIIGYFQIFTQAYLLGGPADSLLFYVLNLFFQAFQYFKMGYACAMAWILFLIILGLTIVQIKLAPRWVHYELERKF
ncbi:MAG: extracellular solute-binding protein [bacterium]|nr:extracellular solute-binding protein [bacterium]